MWTRLKWPFSRVPIASMSNAWQLIDMFKKIVNLWQSLTQKHNKEELRLERERFEVLVQNVQDYAIFALDVNGHIKTWNAGAARFKGYNASEILGKHFSIFYTAADINRAHPAFELQEARKHGRFEEEGQRVRKDGSLFWANVIITAIYDKNHNLTGFLKVTRDITEKKNAEEGLKKLNEELEARVKERTADLLQREGELKEAKHAAEKANLAKSSFIANMSHEIRTPLGAILGFANILGEENLSAEDRDSARDAVERNSHLLTSLIDDILDLSKVEANKLELEITSLDLQKLATDLTATFRPQCESKKVQFDVTIAEGLPAKILTDSLRLKQILYNVIGNAVKFTSHGLISVKVSRQGERLAFAVKDSGLGISEGQKKNLFVPFQQADASITREYGGTGLGLILSKRLAQALGGDLELTQSALQEGTTFTATVKLQPDMTAAVIAAQKASESTKFPGRKLLLVDDNPDNRALLSIILKQMSLVVETAKDGSEAVEHVTRFSPDVILMDLQMPRMDGLTAMLELKKAHLNAPCIALTANAFREEKERCMAAGFSAYLTKPVNRELLAKTLSQFLDA